MSNRTKRWSRIGSRAYLALLPGVAWAVLTEVAIGAVVAVVVAATQLLLDYKIYLREPEEQPRTVSDTADDLAANVESQWTNEAGARGLTEKRMLPVTWSAPAWSEVVGGELPRLLRGGLELTSDRLAENYLGTEDRRLVVVGEPGAGKTALAMMLTLGILGRRKDERTLPVPVLLPLARWDPMTEELDDWLVRTVALTYYGCQERVARTLLDGRRLVAVLDGLDEIPEHRRAHAVEKIAAALDVGRPIVVTCRSAEYQALVEDGAGRLDAPVVEVKALPPRDVIGYLRGENWATGGDWEKVFARITAPGPSPLRTALSLPLMVSVLCTVGRRGHLSPADLLRRSGSRAEVERYLFDRLTSGAGDESAGNARTLRRLSFLALSLQRDRARDIAWWQMSSWLPAWIAPIIGITGGGIVLLAVAGWIAVFDREDTVTVGTTVTVATAAGTAFAVLATVVWLAGAGRSPLRLAPPGPEAMGQARRGFGAGAAFVAIPAFPVLIVLPTVLVIRDGWTVGTFDLYARVLAALVAVIALTGLAFAVSRLLESASGRATDPAPVQSLEDDRRSSLAVAWVAALTFGVMFGPALVAGLTVGRLLSRLATGGTGWPGGAPLTEVVRASAEDVMLRYLPEAGLAVGALALLPAAIAFLLLLLNRAWPRFQIARLVFFLQRRLPWDLMGFLAGARDRELLRESGTTYQFRHARLQERLASLEPAAGPHARKGHMRATSRAGLVTAACMILAVVAALAVPVLRLPGNTARSTLAGQYRLGPYEMTFSPEGTYVATFSVADPDVRVYAVATGSPVATLPSGPLPLSTGRRVTFGPDERFVMIETGLTLNYYLPYQARTKVWELASKRMVLDLPFASVDPSDPSLWFVGDGAVLLGDGTMDEADPFGALISWDLASGRMIKKWPHPSPAPDEHVVDARTGTLVLQEPGRATLWDVPSGDALGWLDERADVSIGTDRTIIAHLPGAEVVQLIDRDNRKTRNSFAQVKSFARAPAGDRVAMLGSDGVLRFVDVTTGDTISAHRLGLSSDRSTVDLEFSPDGRLLTAEQYDSDDLWVLRATEDAEPVRITRSNPGVVAYAASADRLLLSTGTEIGQDERIELVDATSGEGLMAEPRNLSVLTDQGFSADGRLLLLAEDGIVSVYSAATGSLVATVENPVAFDRTDSAFDEGTSPDGTTIVTAEESTGRPDEIRMAIRDAATGRVLADARTIVVYRDPTIAFSADNRLIAAGGADGVIHVFDKSDGRAVATYTGHAGPIDSLTFSPDGGTLATAAADDTVRLWSVPG